MGNKTKYTEAIADEICDIIATSDRGLVSISKEFGVCVKTIFNWIDKNEEFLHKYARARELQAEYLSDQIIEIADETSNDFSVNQDGVEITNHEAIARSRLRVDARKWKASKLAPKKFGDKLDVTSKGQQIEPLTFTIIKGKGDGDKTS